MRSEVLSFLGWSIEFAHSIINIFKFLKLARDNQVNIYMYKKFVDDSAFLWLGRSRLNGMTTPPYPEGTLDTLGFLLGGRLAIRQAVSWPRLPKVALLGSKNAIF